MSEENDDRLIEAWMQIQHAIESLFGSDSVVGPTPPHGGSMGVALRWGDDCRLRVEIDPETLGDFDELPAGQRDDAVRRWVATLVDYKNAAEANRKDGDSPTVLLTRNW